MAAGIAILLNVAGMRSLLTSPETMGYSQGDFIRTVGCGRNCVEAEDA